MKRGKSYIESSKLIDSAKLYDVEEAMEAVIAAEAEKQRETHDAEIVCIHGVKRISHNRNRDKAEACHKFAEHTLKRLVFTPEHNTSYGKSNRHCRKHQT